MRLVISVLVFALSAANSGDAWICAAYCAAAPSAPVAASHHHQMESGATSARANTHIHHHGGAACQKCPPSAGSLSQNTSCTAFVQIQALKEGSFSLRTPSGAANGLPALLTDGMVLAYLRDGTVSFNARSIVQGSSPPSLPLRI